nr:hypothetical protein [Tanacetum cinerariifolium]
TETRPRAAHEVPLLTATANRVIDIEDMTRASGSLGTPSTVDKSPLDFSNEDPPPLITERIGTEGKGQDEFSQGEGSCRLPPLTEYPQGEIIGCHRNRGSTVSAPATQETLVHAKGVSDSDPLSYTKPPPAPEQDIAQEVLEAKTVEVLKVGTEHNVTDALTKVVLGHKLQHCLELLSVGSFLVGNPPYTEVTPKPDLEKETVTMGALVNKRHRKRGPGEAEANAPPKVLRKDHVASHLSRSTLRGKSLAAIGIGVPLSPHLRPKRLSFMRRASSRKAVVTKDLDSEKSASFTSMVGSPGVAMGSQLRLQFEQETKLLKKAVAQVARRDQRIHAREKHIKNLEALLEAEADMKDIAEAKNVEIVKELESLRVQFSDLQVSNHQLSQSDSVPVSVPTVAPQGLAILLADAATRTDITKDETSPKLLRSKSLLPMYSLDWP